MARGLQRVNGNSWSTGYFGRSANASTSMGGAGSINVSSNFGVTSWDLRFNNFKDDLQARCGQWMTFITINGTLWAGTGAANQYPQRYGDLGWINITGPWDTSNLYTGEMKIGNPGDMYWDSGTVYVRYPAGTSQQTISRRGQDTPLPYTRQGDERFQLDEWR